MQDFSLLEPIAVTGATGFIGTHLVRALAEAAYRPILLSRTRKGKKENKYLDSGKELQTIETDLTDYDSIRDAIQYIKPATILHLAGTRGRHDRDGITTMEVNCDATVRLLEEAMFAGSKRIVISGTAEEYGNQPGPLAESLPTVAASPYGISKVLATSRALAMHALHGVPVVVVRPFSVYGPCQPDKMFVAQAIDAALHNVAFEMTAGEQKRDLVFVDDIVEGLIAAASAPGVEGRIINLGSGECHRLREVAELIWKLANTKAPLLIGARSAREDELYDTWADITLARRLLKWEPRVSLEDGLRRTIDFERDRNGMKSRVCQMT